MEQMERQIRIKAGSVIVVAGLYNTKTAEAIWQALPFSSKGNTWGDEIYFSIPLKMEVESGQEIVDFGDLGYWPPGGTFCIFFGQTPVSNKGEIRAASAVDIFGKVVDDTMVFKNVKDGEEIVVERV
ncbi:cyclophilin-like fold protein [Chloroflexota bacterium]